MRADGISLGDRAADWVARNLGRWAFIIGQTGVIAVWMWSGGFGSDGFPFIFLNLALSLQAAYTGPVLLISQNRADRNRELLMQLIERNTELTERHVALIEDHTSAYDRHQQETHVIATETRQLVHDLHALVAEVRAMNARQMEHFAIEWER